jgi:hypothetical protein
MDAELDVPVPLKQKMLMLVASMAARSGAAPEPKARDGGLDPVGFFLGVLPLLFLLGAIAIALRCPKHGAWSVLWAVLFPEYFVAWFAVKKAVGSPDACANKYRELRLGAGPPAYGDAYGYPPQQQGYPQQQAYPLYTTH